MNDQQHYQGHTHDCMGDIKDLIGGEKLLDPQFFHHPAPTRPSSCEEVSKNKEESQKYSCDLQRRMTLLISL